MGMSKHRTRKSNEYCMHPILAVLNIMAIIIFLFFPVVNMITSPDRDSPETPAASAPEVVGGDVLRYQTVDLHDNTDSVSVQSRVEEDPGTFIRAITRSTMDYTPEYAPDPNEEFPGHPEWFTDEHDLLIRAIAMVESSNNSYAVGDGGLAIGTYQIHRNYWIDALQQDPTIGGEYEDLLGDPEYGRKVVIAYWDRYGARVNYEVQGLARIHNGGPNGHKKQATDGYWHRRVKMQMLVFEAFE